MYRETDPAPRVQREGAGERHRAGRPRLEVLAGPRFGLAQFYPGHYRRTIEVRTPQLAALDGALVRECVQMPLLPAVSGRGYVRAAHAALGDFAAAARAAEEALRIASAADHPYSIVHAWWDAGRWRLSRGEFAAAVPWLEQGFDVCRQQVEYGTVGGSGGGR